MNEHGIRIVRYLGDAEQVGGVFTAEAHGVEQTSDLRKLHLAIEPIIDVFFEQVVKGLVDGSYQERYQPGPADCALSYYFVLRPTEGIVVEVDLRGISSRFYLTREQYGEYLCELMRPAFALALRPYQQSPNTRHNARLRRVWAKRVIAESQGLKGERPSKRQLV
jgi:hypothetical protein